MDESHFEDPGARIFKYCFFACLLVVTAVGIWKKEAILSYFSFREFGEAKIVIYTVPATKVSVYEASGNRREVGLAGRDGKFTLVEQGRIKAVRVHLSHPYYFPEEKLFENVEKGQVVTFQAAMTPLLGSIRVQTFPNGATVFVDDEEVGVSPWRKRDIRDGTQLFVEVKSEGFISQYREIVIVGGNEEDLVFSLVPSECTISLETDTAGFSFESLNVFVDGELYTLNGQVLRFVRPGRRIVEVVSHDGLKLQKSINIKPGQTLHMKLPDWFCEDGS
ncbi:MAG: PEGA domain-containing protein [Verrucomicrobia bacterium]|nr:PEGA domain-containing protein [Verrucomicrobiota bacterium]